MIHPTRTNLLLLRERIATVGDSVTLLKGRRQALLREFLQASAPLLQSREKLAALYAEACGALEESRKREGTEFLDGVATAAGRDLGLRVGEGNLLGLRFREVRAERDPRRGIAARQYDERATTPHLEEAIDRFETIVAELLQMAVFEGKVKRLGEELLRLTRRIRTLEERLLPELRRQARQIGRFLGEREREAFYRLKRFKDRRQRGLG
jgi:V/A-type H+-transporting ATPase subunit D